MCFSAPASFAASGVIGLAGILSLKKTGVSRKMLLALIPLFFAMQQFFEGLVWLEVEGVLERSIWTQYATNFYLFFAWAFWPFFIPFAVLFNETVAWKKILFAGGLLIGAYISYCDIVFVWEREIQAVVRENSLFYGGTSTWDRAWYSGLILVPLFLSSVRNLWVFGLLVAISSVISQWIYTMTFTSVWCFFSAAVSFVLYLIL